MFATTLRIEDPLGDFLQEAARQCNLSVNAFLAELIHREQKAVRRRRLAADWAGYALDGTAQEVSYALAAQAETAAEPMRKPYPAPKRRRA
jgi:predicted DNA-binding ribbon-helix-helix protein